MQCHAGPDARRTRCEPDRLSGDEVGDYVVLTQTRRTLGENVSNNPMTG